MQERIHIEIQVQGELSQRWAGWFGGMRITTGRTAKMPSVTTLTGTVADQAALLGLLNKLHNLGLVILLVRREMLPGAVNPGL